MQEGREEGIPKIKNRKDPLYREQLTSERALKPFKGFYSHYLPRRLKEVSLGVATTREGGKTSRDDWPLGWAFQTCLVQPSALQSGSPQVLRQSRVLTPVKRHKQSSRGHEDRFCWKEVNSQCDTKSKLMTALVVNFQICYFSVNTKAGLSLFLSLC